MKHAMKQSVAKLNPKVMIKNPIMFVVEIGFVITFILSFFQVILVVYQDGLI